AGWRPCAAPWNGNWRRASPCRDGLCRRDSAPVWELWIEAGCFQGDGWKQPGLGVVLNRSPVAPARGGETLHVRRVVRAVLDRWHSVGAARTSRSDLEFLAAGRTRTAAAPGRLRRAGHRPGRGRPDAWVGYLRTSFSSGRGPRHGPDRRVADPE